MARYALPLPSLTVAMVALANSEHPHSIFSRIQEKFLFSLTRKSSTSEIRDNLVAAEKDGCVRGSMVKINEGEGKSTNSNVL